MNNLLRRNFMRSNFRPFIMEVETTSASQNFILPLAIGETYNMVVDWGDGSSNVITTDSDPNLTHTYTIAGVYDITMTGINSGLRFNNGGSKLLVNDIKQWGSIEFIISAAFYGCSNMIVTATDVPRLINNAGGNFFMDCTSITTIPNINNWDMSNITSLVEFFRNTSFNQPLDNWNTSNVTTMNNMFRGTIFNQDISSFNVTSLLSASGMFSVATGLSTANYDALLIGWEAQAVQNNVVFDGGNSTYTLGGAAETARTNLINDHSWTITDGGGI